MKKNPFVLLGALVSASLLLPAACSNSEGPGGNNGEGGSGSTETSGDGDSGTSGDGDSTTTGDTGDSTTTGSTDTGDTGDGTGASSGSGGDSGTGASNGSGGNTVTCTLQGDSCSDSDECCSGICDDNDTCTCSSAGKDCLEGADCCSGQCNPTTNTCAQVLGVCSQDDTPCTDATECCTLSCVDGLCGSEACTLDTETCTSDDQCCSGNCSDEGACLPLADPNVTQCNSAGNSCSANGDCCSGLCDTDAGTCLLGASYCVQRFDACSSDAQCCGGSCVMGDGLLGYCDLVSAGMNNGTDCGGLANNGLFAGSVCDGDCKVCCSKTCAPYGPSGVSICQPAGGCRISGELCREDNDCCGGEDGGTGFCRKENPDDLIGQCKYTSCAPDGALCAVNKANAHLLACGESPATNDGQKCCGKATADGPMDDPCSPDPLLIPRCDGIIVDCDANDGGQEGDRCATSQDCCDGRSCLQGESGDFVCSGSGVDGCQPAGEACSATADCCVGSLCIIEPGQGSGVCGTPDSPPVDGSGGAGGTTGSGGSNSGSGGSDSSGSGGSGSTDVCAAFGQSCKVYDCCNGIPCDAATETCRFSSGG